MAWIDDLWQRGLKKGQSAAESIAKHGEIMMPTLEEIAASAAYNRLASAAKPVINNLDTDAAKEVISAIRKGEDFGTQALNDMAEAMANSGDEAQVAAVMNLSKLADDFNSASSQNTVEAYAAFLGREDGKIGFINSIEGYFGDKRHGVKRIHTAVGTAAGIGIANRLLSGGSLTRTNTGERDIAGVPFF
jgi:hypothetical protein